VCKPGGRIGLANWTPEGFIGQMFKTIGKYLPPPTGVKSLAVWGTRSWIETTFHAAASTIAAEPRHFVFRYRSAQHFLEIFRTYYGPMLKAFEAIEGVSQKALARDIIDLIGRFNTSGDQTMVVPSEYLEVVITKDETAEVHMMWTSPNFHNLSRAVDLKSHRKAVFSPARQRRAPWKKQQDLTQLGPRLLEPI
jgi:hypothetical protein